MSDDPPVDDAVALDAVAPGGDAPAAAEIDYELIYDRITGAFLGSAVGDAFAVQADGLDVFTSADRVGDGKLDYPYKGTRGGLPPLDWSDATDTAALTARTLVAWFTEKTEEPDLHLALALTAWQKRGYPELGDATGVGCEGVTLRVVTRPGYAADPIATARIVSAPKAENGAMLRALPCAFTTNPAEWTVRLSEITHSDERSLAAAVAYADLLGRLARLPAGDAPTPALLAAAVRAGRVCLQTPTHREEYYDWITTRSTRLRTLALEDREQRTYAFKTLGVAVWAFRQVLRTPAAKRTPDFFMARLRELAMSGGDATANCAVAGAIFGVVGGAAILPTAWLDAVPRAQHDWLSAELHTYLKAVAATW